MAPPTLVHFLRERAATSGDSPAVWHKTGDAPYRSWSWRQVESMASRFGRGLLALKLRTGRPLAVICGARPEWLSLEMGAMGAGFPPGALFDRWPEQELAEILRRIEPAAVVVEAAAQVGRLRSLLGAAPEFVVLDPGAPRAERVHPLADVLALGEAQDLSAWNGRVDAIDPTGVAALWITQGTLDVPKVLRHSHASCLSHARRLARAAGIGLEDALLSRASPAFPLERALLRVAALDGAQIYCAPEGRSFAEHLREVRPTVAFGTPEDWESVRRGLEARLAGEPPNRQKVIAWARKAELEAQRFEDDSLPLPTALRAQRAVGTALVSQPLKVEAGLQAVRTALVGLSPARRETLEFFAGLGVTLDEAWGLAEAGGPVAFNGRDGRRRGTQGRPLPGIAVRVAPDGEILLRGDTLAQSDGAGEWLHTGDVGELDPTGFLTVHGRRDELLPLRGRRRVAPQLVETRLRTVPLVARAIAFAERRQPVALLELDPERAMRFAREHGIPEDLSQLSSHPALHARLKRELAAAQRDAPETERVRRFAVLPDALSLPEGELTPAGTVRRRVVARRRASLLHPLIEKTRVRRVGIAQQRE